MEITEAQFKEFKKLYEQAVKKDAGTFMFMERTVLTKYAGYVIEAMEAKQ